MPSMRSEKRYSDKIRSIYRIKLKTGNAKVSLDIHIAKCNLFLFVTPDT